MRWPYTHGGSLVAFPEVGLLGKSCWRIVRVPQNLCLTPLQGMRLMLLFFCHRGTGVAPGDATYTESWNPPLRRARACPSLPLTVAALPLKLSLIKCRDLSFS